MMMLWIDDVGGVCVQTEPLSEANLQAIADGRADYIRFNFAEHRYEHAEVNAGELTWVEVPRA